MPFGFDLIIIALMLVLNAIFAAYEMALASITQSRIDMLLSEKRRGAADAAFMKGRMEASLAIVQLGITLAGTIAAAIGGAGFEEKLAPYLRSQWGLSALFSEVLALLLLIVPLTLLIIMFAELIPKMLALKNKELVVLKLSPVMKSLSTIAYPIVLVVELGVKKAVKLLSGEAQSPADVKLQGLYELKAAASLGRTSKLLGAREEKMVLAAAQLSMRTVRDIMIPASDIVMIRMESSLADALVRAHLDMHTRFPVCTRENDPQSIQGYVNFKDIMMALRIKPEDPTVRGITRPIMRIDEEMSIADVLENMMKENAHIGIATSRDGCVSGMVALENIIEELVGNIEDEFDRQLTHIKPYGSGWTMGGGVPINRVASTLGLDWTGRFPDGHVPTLGEWCAQILGRPLTGGEIIEHDGVRVVPWKFRRKRMSEAIVSLIR
ncbi:MAG: hemolysin family protein [Candidatus Aureabacteria bacterium]|nr:hemolysin family protein [Candidatus Auribacterota bacterium]